MAIPYETIFKHGSVTFCGTDHEFTSEGLEFARDLFDHENDVVWFLTFEGVVDGESPVPSIFTNAR